MQIIYLKYRKKFRLCKLFISITHLKTEISTISFP